jgi:hypothetical protein
MADWLRRFASLCVVLRRIPKLNWTATVQLDFGKRRAPKQNDEKRRRGGRCEDLGHVAQLWYG